MEQRFLRPPPPLGGLSVLPRKAFALSFGLQRQQCHVSLVQEDLLTHRALREDPSP